MKKISLIVLLGSLIIPFLSAQNVKFEEVKLDNGFTIYLHEDHSKPEVFGAIIVRAGSKDDPADATGMAHYMEHMLFKGTTELGTTDWEKEAPHIKNIFKLYEELGKATEDTVRARIQKNINLESLEAGKYAIPNEMSNILNSIGGTNMNAGTGPDYTVFYNAFPPTQVEKWLELYSHRFIDPVFRSFQAELEVVYEEKNMYSDMFIFNLISEFGKKFFKNHPYGQRDRVGTIDDLKNPSLTKMYEFFKTHYVAGNMALSLSGDFDSEQIKPLLKEKFSRLNTGPIPERLKYEEAPFNGREYYEANLSPIKIGMLGFRTVPETHPDYLPLLVANGILSNGNQTGLLDKLMLDGKLLAAQVMPMPYNDHGATIILAIPKIIGQKLDNAEELVMTEMKKLRDGEFTSEQVEAIRNQLYVDHQLSLESNENVAVTIASYYAQYRDVNDINTYVDRIKSITKEEVVRVANKYYGDNYLAFYSKMGFKKPDKIDKPDYEPLVANTAEKSKFAKYFESIPSGEPKPVFVDFEKDFNYGTIQEGVEIYSVANPKNDIFTLKMRFNAGTEKIPGLEYGLQSMNLAGVEGKDVAAYKTEFSNIGCSYSVSGDESYTVVEISGLEENFPKAIGLINQLLTKPELDQKKIDMIVQAVSSERKMERSEPDNVASALVEYVKYKEKSDYIDRLTISEIKALKADSLEKVFLNALQYNVEMHFVGNTPFDKLIDIIANGLTLPEKPIKGDGVFVRESQEYSEDEIYFVNKKKSVQSKIFVMAGGVPYDIKTKPVIEAFNMYFGGGFSGLVLQEIREYRSLAYSAGATYRTPQLPGKKTSFIGYVGTQADKTLIALDVFHSLIREMPDKKDRMDMIREYLIQSAVTDRPDHRDLTESVSYWKQLGYKEDPSKVKMESYKKLSYDDIRKFYEANLMKKPLTYAFVGDKKRIDMKEVAKYGKIIEIKEKSLFH